MRFRIGQIVPSSNTTMETEIPVILRRFEAQSEHRFTFHSSRMRMKKVTREELAAMDSESVRCAQELSDARVDVMGYACLVAIMSAGHGYHRASSAKLEAAAAENGGPAPVVTSAGALIEGLTALGIRKVAVIAPYTQELTDLVLDYIRAEGFEITSHIALGVPDNLEVGARDPMALVDVAKGLDLAGAEALVLSACVQMPSLEAIPVVQATVGIPVISAAVCTAYRMLKSLGLDTKVPDAGLLLSGEY